MSAFILELTNKFQDNIVYADKFQNNLDKIVDKFFLNHSQVRKFIQAEIQAPEIRKTIGGTKLIFGVKNSNMQMIANLKEPISYRKSLLVAPSLLEGVLLNRWVILERVLQLELFIYLFE